MYTQHAIDRVRAFWRKTGLSRRAFARQAGISEGTTWLMDDPEWRPNTTTLLKLEALVPDDFMPLNDAKVAE